MENVDVLFERWGAVTEDSAGRASRNLVLAEFTNVTINLTHKDLIVFEEQNGGKVVYLLSDVHKIAMTPHGLNP